MPLAANVAGLYGALRDDIANGSSTVPDFDHAVRLTRLVGEVLHSAAAGTRISAPRASRQPRRGQRRPHPEEMRRQPTFKLPIEGGLNQKAPKQKTAAEPEVEQTSAEKRKVRRKA